MLGFSKSFLIVLIIAGILLWNKDYKDIWILLGGYVIIRIIWKFFTE